MSGDVELNANAGGMFGNVVFVYILAGLQLYFDTVATPSYSMQ